MSEEAVRHAITTATNNCIEAVGVIGQVKQRLAYLRVSCAQLPPQEIRHDLELALEGIEELDALNLKTYGECTSGIILAHFGLEDFANGITRPEDDTNSAE